MTSSPASHIVGAVPVHAMHRRQAGKKGCGVRTLLSDDGHAGRWKRFVLVCKVLVRYGGYVVAVIYIRTDR